MKAPSPVQVIFGIHAVQAALEQAVAEPATASVQELWLDSRRQDQRHALLQQLAADAGIVVHEADRTTLARLAPEGRHQGVVARISQPLVRDEADLSRLLENLETPAFFLVLDGVQDPHNLGACLRSADAAGVHGVIVPRDRAVSLTPTVIKVASGAAQTVAFFQVTNLARTLRDLKQAGVWLLALDGQAEQSLYETDLTGPVAIVMGAEGQGLRRLTREQCDFLVAIPMAGSVESLNVSVATGVCLFEALRQRRHVAGQP